MMNSMGLMGPTLCLTEKELEKIGLDHNGCEVGGMCHGHFIARVRSVDHHASPHGETCSIVLEIEDLEIESEDEENEEQEED